MFHSATKKFRRQNLHFFGQKRWPLWRETKNLGDEIFFVPKSFSDEFCIFGDKFYSVSKTEFVVVLTETHY